MSTGNSSNDGNHNSGGNNDEGWGSKFLKLASAAAATAAVAGGLIALMSSSSPQPSPFETSARRVIKEPVDEYNYEAAPSLPIRWTKPEWGWVKLNVDGSRDHIGYPPSSGCGGVMRDASGTWLLGFSQKLNPSYEVHMTEIVAILKGVKLAREMNVQKLVVESDLESAVSMVENGVRANHPQYTIISSIKQLLSDPKWEVKVVHIPREANRVANKLARDARDLTSEYMRKYPYPPASCTTLVQEDSQGDAVVGYY
ncbi:hypothetical protein Lal_00030672 [Lupinus albus]|uniref:Putative ribonuclease H-like domain-containing protein n=1 Tax=Lupinus albus TaxID=3870 RepID=A0A6A4P9U5_LUPAL|nr:putative ribonuclease H-like domain-containing protein [Lupinus albus]KAF1863605.1 hypothetical protein Lal_00030672 [Lupinus albus]